MMAKVTLELIAERLEHIQREIVALRADLLRLQEENAKLGPFQILGEIPVVGIAETGVWREHPLGPPVKLKARTAKTTSTAANVIAIARRPGRSKPKSLSDT